MNNRINRLLAAAAAITIILSGCGSTAAETSDILPEVTYAPSEMLISHINELAETSSPEETEPPVYTEHSSATFPQEIMETILESMLSETAQTTQDLPEGSLIKISVDPYTFSGCSVSYGCIILDNELSNERTLYFRTDKAGNETLVVSENSDSGAVLTVYDIMVYEDLTAEILSVQSPEIPLY